MWVPPEVRDPILWHHPTRRAVGYFGAVRLRDGRFLYQRESQRFNGSTFFGFLRQLRATDGQPGVLGGNDAVFAVPTSGADRGFVRQFFSGVLGAEVASLIMDTRNTTLFTAIQHPGEGGTLEDPVSYFPDDSQPPRPSVMAITKTGGPDCRIGS
jgi:secreted PhoX family phosphatase